jgi:hypothetical protein
MTIAKVANRIANTVPKTAPVQAKATRTARKRKAYVRTLFAMAALGEPAARQAPAARCPFRLSARCVRKRYSVAISHV